MSFHANSTQRSRRAILCGVAASGLNLVVPPAATVRREVVEINYVELAEVELAEEDEAWARLGEEEFLRGYAESDSIYDDL